MRGGAKVDLIILKPKEQTLGLIEAFDVTLKEALPLNITLSFKTLEKISEQTRVYIPIESSEKRCYEFIATRVIRDEKISRVDCEASIYELFGYFVEDKRTRDDNGRETFEKILSGTRWQVDYRAEQATTNSLNFYRTSVREAVQKVLETFDVEALPIVTISSNSAKTVTRKLEIHKRIGRDNGRRFEAGKDLLKLTKTVDSTDIITALYGFGKGESTQSGGYGRRLDFARVNNNKMFVENSEAKNIYGVKNEQTGARENIFGVKIFHDVEDVNELLTKTKEALAILSKPKITYKVAVAVDSNEKIKVGLGDTVTLADDDLGNLKGRVTGKVTNLETLETKLTIETRENATQMKQRDERKLLSEVSEKIANWDNPSKNINLNEVKGFVEKLNNDLNSGLNRGKIEYFTGGIRFISEDGRSAMELSPQGLRIAKGKLSTGAWNWTVLSTGNGLGANVVGAENIKAGAIKADHIEASVIKSKIGKIGGFRFNENYLENSNSKRTFYLSGDTNNNFLLAKKAGESEPLFKVDWNGYLTAKDVNIKGNVEALTGRIGRFLIKDDMIYWEDVDRTMLMNCKGTGNFLALKMKAENDTRFSVSWDGKLRAMQADVRGSITAERGRIGAWDITDNMIKSEDSNRVLFLNCTGTGYFLYAKKKSDKEQAFSVDWNGEMVCKRAIIDGKTITGTASNLRGTVYRMGGSVSSVSGSVSGLTGSIYSMGGSVSNLSGTLGGVSGTVGALSGANASFSGSVRSQFGTLGSLDYNSRPGVLNFTGGSVSARINSSRIDVSSLYAGSIYYSGTLQKTSDENLKTNIQDVSEEEKDEIYNIKIKRFSYKETPNQTQLGVIAQDVIKALPTARQREVIKENEQGYFTVDYEQLFISSILAIQKLNNRIEKLEKELKEIKENVGND